MSDLLILEWSRERVEALLASLSGQPHVRKSATLESIDHADSKTPAAQAGESLRAWLESNGIAAGPTIVVVPREAVVLRKLQLPQAPPDELPELVRFQAATRTSAPIESLVLDFLPLPGAASEQGLEVVSCTMDRETLARIESICAAAKLDLQRVTISSLTVGQLVRAIKAPDLGMEQSDLVVYQQGSRLELSIFDFGTLLFSHSTQLPNPEEGSGITDLLKPLKSDLSRCLVTLAQERPQARVGRCFYVCGTPQKAVRDLLEQRFPEGVIGLDSGDLLSGRVPAGYEAAYGAALPEAEDRFHLDLLHPRKRKEIPDRRKWYYGIGTAATLLAMVMAYALFHSKKSALESSIHALQADVNSKTEQLKKGKPKADAFQRIAHWAEGDTDPIELWNQLRAQLTSTDRIYFTEIRVIPLAGEMQARYVGRGHARSRTDVDSLNQMLSDHGFRVRPTTASQGSRDPDYPWEFDLDVELPRGVTVTPPSKNNMATTQLPASK